MMRALDRAVLACFAMVALGYGYSHAQIPTAELDGIFVDDIDAQHVGTWTNSTSVKGYIGAGYIHASNSGLARFELKVEKPGPYHVLVAYTYGSNRCPKVPVEVITEASEDLFHIDQTKTPVGYASFHDLGAFDLPAGKLQVVVSAEGTTGAVIADAVQLLTARELENARKNVPQPRANVPVAKKNAPAKKAPPEYVPKLNKVATRGKTLTPAELDKLIEPFLGSTPPDAIVDDATFLRRISLDAVGRQPTVDELQGFLADTSAEKRQQAVQQLLASNHYGENWGNYWSDVIKFRTPQPQLTFLNYEPFREWLAEAFNQNRSWDEITFEIVTASGKVAQNPAATFVGFHQADKSRLAAETTRIFLGTQIQCAECHDHKFIDMPMETFHHFAAFFVRTDAALPWNDSSQIEVKSKKAGEHKMPGGKGEMQPIAFEVGKADLGMADLQRRESLANWIVSPTNPWFAKAYVNRIWARMMGRGFCEPVDEIGELADVVMPEVHAALAEHFRATGYDTQALFSLIAATEAYQRAPQSFSDQAQKLLAIDQRVRRLRGDEVFDSLARATELPNVTPPPPKAAPGIRFPPPPKSTRDLVNEAYGFDPSLPSNLVVRSMKQAMFMMNNDQLQAQIKADADTILASILNEQSDNDQAVADLYLRVLARPPEPRELEILRQHIAKVGDRQAAFEDILWSLLNSAEFTSKP